MNVLTLLEYLANNVHYRIKLDELITDQPVEIQKAFLANDGARLRNQLGDTNHLADKSAVVQIIA